MTFTNNLFPSGALLGGGSAPRCISGASGRLWVTNDGRGRIELQSDAGDAQIVWNDDDVSVYDASSNTVYRATLPDAQLPRHGHGRRRRRSPTIDDLPRRPRRALRRSPARSPANVAGQAAYSVSVSPEARRRPARLGRARLGRGARRAAARRGLRAGQLVARRSSSTVTEISYGAVPASRRRRRAARRREGRRPRHAGERQRARARRQ